MKAVNLPRLRCALLGLLPLGERRAQLCPGRPLVTHEGVKMKTAGQHDPETVDVHRVVARKTEKF